MTALKIRGRSHATSQLEKIYQPRSWVELVNRGAFHRPADCGNRPERRHKDDVARLKSHIMAAISGHEELIEIHVGHNLIVADQFDLP